MDSTLKNSTETIIIFLNKAMSFKLCIQNVIKCDWRKNDSVIVYFKFGIQIKFVTNEQQQNVYSPNQCNTVRRKKHIHSFILIDFEIDQGDFDTAYQLRTYIFLLLLSLFLGCILSILW